MNTERRKSRRTPLALDVVLSHRAQAVICTLRDISLDGAFVHTETDMLPRAGTVELSLAFPTGTGVTDVRLPATVRRTAPDGVGLRFGDVSADAYFGLVDLVMSPRGAAPARAR